MLILLADYARRNGRTPATARQLAARGGFRTAKKVGRDWMIEADEPYPDNRQKRAKRLNELQSYIPESWRQEYPDAHLKDISILLEKAYNLGFACAKNEL